MADHGNIKHGHARRRRKTLEYLRWESMVRRCTNPRQESYRFYGAQGVTVAAEWLGAGGFEAFLAQVGPIPGREYSVDRIDSTKGYQPGNVRWATMREQQRNRTNNRMITAAGRTQCLAAWAAELGCGHTVILTRIRRHGWSEERAVTTPVGPVGRPRVRDFGTLSGHHLRILNRNNQ